MKSPRSRPPMCLGRDVEHRGDGTMEGGGVSAADQYTHVQDRVADLLVDAICPICWFANVR